MTIDRDGMDCDQQVSRPAENNGPPGGQDSEGKREQPEDRDDSAYNRPFRGRQRSGPPDPSRASNAERYSYHKRPLE